MSVHTRPLARMMVLGTSAFFLTITTLVVTVSSPLDKIQNVFAQSPPPPPPYQFGSYPDVTNTGSYLEGYPFFDLYKPGLEFIEIWPEFSMVGTGSLQAGTGSSYYVQGGPRLYVVPLEFKNPGPPPTDKKCPEEWLDFVLAREEHGPQHMWAHPLAPLMITYLYKLEKATTQMREMEATMKAEYGDFDPFASEDPPEHLQDLYRENLNKIGLYASAIRGMRMMEPSFRYERQERWHDVKIAYNTWLQCETTP